MSTSSGSDAERPPARIREMPGPRKPTGMIAPAVGVVFAWPYRLLLAGCYRAGLRPWQLTVLSLAANAVVGWLIVSGMFLVSGLLLIAAGVLDVLDGGLARLRGEASRAGAFLDSVIDRCSDVIVFGALYWALSGQGKTVAAGFALASLALALVVSFVRAQAEALDVPLTEGIAQRLERYLALIVGLLFPGTLLWVLVLLTALGALTAVQRIASAWRQLAPAAA